ncbi:hypothetical protein [Cohnella sp.]|uniref:hypothetical protein n=1 Tax=Cohnella sp. TaxID=1883426 RepID=UPI003567AA4C
MKSPVKLSAGPLQAFFEEGGLRTIAYDGLEIVRGIYAAVRDRNWGTVAPRLKIKRIQSLHDQAIVEFHCRHAQDEIDFEWNGLIRMTPDSIRFDFDGIARASFQKNRIGFCVLHPMDFAGLPLEVDTEEGIARGAFPERIAPHQPFKGVRAMTYEPALGCRVRTIFSGDLFEMEDQRNWTDASYKTYCTPLSVPYPASVQAGERIAQSVLIEIEGPTAEEVGLGRGGAYDGARREAVRIALRRESRCSLPSIGIAIGMNVIDSRAAERLSRLKPSHLRGTLDLSRDEWPIRLKEVVDAADRVGCGLELEVLLDEGGRRAAELAKKLAASGVGQEARGRGMWLIPYSAGAIVTDEAALRVMRSAMRAGGLELPVGGGTRAYYAEFNRSTLPVAGMDFAAYSINPQVHAFDDRSLMETLAAQRTTADDAAFKSGKPLSIGPITFKPRLNPNATSGDGSIPIADQIDDRQGEKFGAAWTLGSLAALCTPETRRLTYYEASGPLGVTPDGAPIPLYFLLKDVMAEPAARVLAVQCSSGRAAALALRHPEGRLRLMVANLENEALEVDIDLGADSNYSVATNFVDGESEERETEQLSAQAGRRVILTLPPYGCIRLDCRETDATDAAESTENAHEKGL